MRQIKSIFTILVVVFLAGACQPIQATVPQPQATAIVESPSRVLFIGDSFSWFFQDYFPKLATSTSPPTDVEVGLIWIGGAPLSLHWASPSTLKIIQTGDWDVVVLQEDIAENWSRVEQFPEYARKFHDEIQHADAQTVLYMHWPWKSQPEPSVEQIAEVYGKVGTDLGVKVAPVGLAWQRALQERPELDLYDRDLVHANPYGTYLTLCVLYATIFERSPVGATYRQAAVKDEEAAFLQRIAWDTVVDYAAQR